MRWLDIPRHPSRSTLRQFALLWVVAAAGFACWQWFHYEKRIAAGVFGAATVVGFWGCWRPLDLRHLFVGWMVLTFPVAWIVSKLLLGSIFFLVFTPIGLVFRLMGRDPLDRRWDPTAETYWQPKRMNSEPKSYLNQF